MAISRSGYAQTGCWARGGSRFFGRTDTRHWIRHRPCRRAPPRPLTRLSPEKVFSCHRQLVTYMQSPRHSCGIGGCIAGQLTVAFLDRREGFGGWTRSRVMSVVRSGGDRNLPQPLLLLTCAPATAAVPRIPFAHVPLSSSPLQPTAAAAAMTLLLFLPPSDEESTLAPGRPAVCALLTSSPSSRVGMDRKSPHGATEEWESRDRTPAAVGHETAPGVAVSGVQAAMTGCWRRGGWIHSHAVASDGSQCPGASLSGCSSATGRVDVI